MYAIKENEVILQGTQNYTNGLWDILIKKSAIQITNYVELMTHATLYIIKDESNEVKITTMKKETLKKGCFFNVFCGLNNSIDVNVCDHFVDKQLNKDETSFTKVNL